MNKQENSKARSFRGMTRRKYLAHDRKSLLLVSLVTLSLCQTAPGETSDLDAYPKASDDATMVYRLQSNWENTHFFIDGKEMGIGRKLTIRVNSQGHTIVARPEGCAKTKEEFVQPPYSPDAPLGFTFFPEECNPKTVERNKENKPEHGPIVITGSKGPIIIGTGGNVTGIDTQISERPPQERRQEPGSRTKPLAQKDAADSQSRQISPRIMEAIVAMQAMCLASSDLTIEAEGGGSGLVLRKGANVEGRYRETEIPTLLKKLQNEVGLMKEASEIRKCMDEPKQKILDYILHKPS